MHVLYFVEISFIAQQRGGVEGTIYYKLKVWSFFFPPNSFQLFFFYKCYSTVTYRNLREGCPLMNTVGYCEINYWFNNQAPTAIIGPYSRVN